MMSYTTNPETERTRRHAIAQLMATTGSRRSLLKTAAVAGLIPVLTSADVAARAVAQDAQPVRGGRFITLGHHDVSQLSPDNDGETVIWAVVTQLFDSLYVVNEQFELEPVLAESYEPSADGKTYTFRLRQGVKFHNGDDFTSADVKYTLDWIKDPKNASTRGSSVELVASVDAPDPLTVVINLTEADATFMVNVATLSIYPSKYHAATGEEAFKGKPVGTGPFTVKEWIPAQRTVLAANEQYFRGRPNFDEFQMDIVPEAAGRMAALETGQADNSVWSLNAEDNVVLEESGNFTVFKVLNNAVNHFTLNNEHPVLSDVNVRKALLHATDRQAFIDDVYQGQAVIATSNLSPNVEKFYNPNVPTYDYNPETARQLLDQAGWVAGGDGMREKGGQKAAFTLSVIQGDSQRRPEAELAQQWYKDIGVDMQIREATDVVDGTIEGKYDAGLFNWVYGGGSGEPDARDTLSSNGANNFSHFKNAEVDSLLQEGIRELDEARRIEIYNRVQEIVAENVPFLYFLHPQGYSFWVNSIKGLPETVLSSDSLYQNIFKLWKQE
jgi:peptide/nickel transport system substrate-binding protein